MGNIGHRKIRRAAKERGASLPNINALQIMPIVKKVAKWRNTFSSDRANELRGMLGLPLPGQKTNNKKPLDFSSLPKTTNLSSSDLEDISTAIDVIDRHIGIHRHYPREVRDLRPFQETLERTKKAYEARDKKPTPQEPLSATQRGFPDRPIDTSYLDNPLTRILRAP